MGKQDSAGYTIRAVSAGKCSGDVRATRAAGTGRLSGPSVKDREAVLREADSLAAHGLAVTPAAVAMRLAPARRVLASQIMSILRWCRHRVGNATEFLSSEAQFRAWAMARQDIDAGAVYVKTFTAKAYVHMDDAGARLLEPTSAVTAPGRIAFGYSRAASSYCTVLACNLSEPLQGAQPPIRRGRGGGDGRACRGRRGP